MGRWFPGCRDWNGYADSTGALEPFLATAASLKNSGCTFLVLHHARKSGGTGVDAAIGSAAIGGAFDHAVTLEKASNDLRKLTVEGRHGTGGLAVPTAFQIQDGIAYTASIHADVEFKIIATLEESDAPMGSADLMDTVEWDKTDRSFRNVLAGMVKAGSITADGENKGRTYSIKKVQDGLI